MATLIQVGLKRVLPFLGLVRLSFEHPVSVVSNELHQLPSYHAFTRPLQNNMKEILVHLHAHKSQHMNQKDCLHGVGNYAGSLSVRIVVQIPSQSIHHGPETSPLPYKGCQLSSVRVKGNLQRLNMELRRLLAERILWSPFGGQVNVTEAYSPGSIQQKHGLSCPSSKQSMHFSVLTTFEYLYEHSMKSSGQSA
jgi:hypothetical protein